MLDTHPTLTIIKIKKIIMKMLNEIINKCKTKF